MEDTKRYKSDHMDNLKATELRLGPPGTDEEEIPTPVMTSRGNKRALPEDSDECQYSRISSEISSVESHLDASSAAKAQVVGWPPIRSYRQKSFKAMKEVEKKGGGLYVKVSMDGAPYLRKIDLNVYQGYEELRLALEDMFKFFSIGDLYAIAYEDKDGDLMLVGDVPWGMFISSCKRMRIMKGCEARGLSSSS